MVRPPVEMGERGFNLRTLDDAIRFAQGLVQGGMVPKAFDKLGDKAAGAIVGLLQAGSELGLPHMYALSNLTFVNGRLGIMGDAARSVVKMRGGLKPGTDFRVEYEGAEGTPEWTCKVTAHRTGADEPSSASFSIADAIRAGLCRIHQGQIQARGYNDWNSFGPWAAYPKRMLMYRALGFLVRDTFGDLLAGAVLVEELADYPQSRVPERDVTPPKEPDPLLVGSANLVDVGEAPPSGQGVQEAGPGGSVASPPSDPYAGQAWAAVLDRAKAGELTDAEADFIAAELEARPGTRDKNKARVLRQAHEKAASRGARGTAPQSEEPASSSEGSAMPQQADAPVAPAPTAALDPSPADEPERDPDTGEVIPDHVGRTPLPEEPQRVEGFTHVGDAVGQVMGELERTGKIEPPPIEAAYQVEPEDGTGPFDARPQEAAEPRYIDREQRSALIALLGQRGHKKKEAALMFVSTLLDRKIETTETITVEEHEKLLQMLNGASQPQDEMF